MSASATEKGDISDFVQHDGNPTTLSDKLEEARTFVYSADKLYQTYIEKGHTLTRHGIPGFHNAAHALCYKLGLIPQQSFFDPVDPSPDHWALLLVSHSIRVPSDAELLSCSPAVLTPTLLAALAIRHIRPGVLSTTTDNYDRTLSVSATTCVTHS